MHFKALSLFSLKIYIMEGGKPTSKGLVASSPTSQSSWFAAGLFASSGNQRLQVFSKKRLPPPPRKCRALGVFSRSWEVFGAGSERILTLIFGNLSNRGVFQ